MGEATDTARASDLKPTLCSNGLTNKRLFGVAVQILHVLVVWHFCCHCIKTGLFFTLQKDPGATMAESFS
jgi:hypothetical protein